MTDIRKKLDAAIYSGIGVSFSWQECKELIALQTENKRFRDALDEIEAVSCGEEQIECDGVYDDSDGMKWIYDRIQALKGEPG